MLEMIFKSFAVVFSYLRFRRSKRQEMFFTVWCRFFKTLVLLLASIKTLQRTASLKMSKTVSYF